MSCGVLREAVKNRWKSVLDSNEHEEEKEFLDDEEESVDRAGVCSSCKTDTHSFSAIWLSLALLRYFLAAPAESPTARNVVRAMTVSFRIMVLVFLPVGRRLFQPRGDHGREQ